MHLRNIHRYGYDFQKLTLNYPMRRTRVLIVEIEIVCPVILAGLIVEARAVLSL